MKFIPVPSFASHLHVRVRVFNPNPNPYSHGNSCHCLFAIWLVESFNWYASHCLKAFGAVFSEFQSVIRPFRKLKLSLELSENLSCTLKRRASCTMSLETIDKYWKSHLYSCKTAFYSYISMKAYRRKIRKTWWAQVEKRMLQRR